MNVLRGAAFFADASFPFFIQKYTIRRGEVVPTHTHDFLEFVYVAQGGATHDIATQRYSLSTGDVFVLEPETYHSYTGSDAEDTIVYNVLFKKEFLQREFDDLLRMPAIVNSFYLAPFLRKSASFIPHVSLLPGQRTAIETHLSKMSDEFKSQSSGYRLILKSRWIECLVLLNRFYEENGSADESSLGKDEWMRSIVHFVREHYRQPLTLAQLSATCGMSVSSFTAKFKKATGMSFLDYKHSLQIRHACDMLRTTDIKIVYVAYSAGFQDVSFFNRVFRKHTGMSPRHYRRLQGSQVE
ncbi:AraC family transcriptional regulator [Paenibacillus sp.]|uniref:AraC family transcriptional regulator n=1 Tax=Paenibacillus sp. TaxID=58172 RepID=UPI002811B243|nr:AraC family transcriptional regulator [Paenibacillus sp.]